MARKTSPKAKDPARVVADLLPLLRDIEGMKLDSANARKHSQRSIDAIAASLVRFKQRKPIVIDSAGVVRAGNGLVQAAKSLGWAQVAAVVIDESATDSTAYAIADNRIAELSEWDNEILSAQVLALDEDEFDLRALGFDDSELERLLQQASSDGNEAGETSRANESTDDQVKIPANITYRVIVEVSNAEEQAELCGRLEEEGFKCQMLMS